MSEKPFYQRLKEAIDADPELTEAGLAVKAGLNNSTVRRIISDKRFPQISTAEKICAALGTTYDKFMSDDFDPENLAIQALWQRLRPELRQRLLGYGEALEIEQDRFEPSPTHTNKQ